MRSHKDWRNGVLLLRVFIVHRGKNVTTARCILVCHAHQHFLEIRILLWQLQGMVQKLNTPMNLEFYASNLYLHLLNGA